MASAQATRRVLWAANVRTKGLDDRLVAANAGGFSHISVFPIDFRNWSQAGMTGAEMRRRLDDSGVKVLAIDPFVQWVPGFAIPSGYPEDYRQFIDFPEEEIFRIADELEAEAINCVEGLGQPHRPEALADAFGAFADRAGERGLRVTFEFMPISSVADLAAGWAIVEGAARENAGLCFDTWHFVRSGADMALLRRLAGEKIFEVQLADGLKELQAPTLSEDLLRFRRLPGHGEFDLRPVVDALKQLGAWRSVGPEVFADAMDALGAEEAGAACGAALGHWN